MTEAELRRLAEIMAELSQTNTRPGLDLWSALFGALVGIFSRLGASLIMDLRLKRHVREARLRRARKKIYPELVKCRDKLADIRAKSTEAETPGFKSYTDAELDTISRGIYNDLWNAHDFKYWKVFLEATEASRQGQPRDYLRQYDAIVKIIEDWQWKYKPGWTRLQPPSRDDGPIVRVKRWLERRLRGRGGLG